MQPWDFANLVSSNAWVDCGAFNVDFYLNDGAKTPLDPLLFTSTASVPGPGFDFNIVMTEDYNHIGVYDIAYTVSYADYPTNFVDQTTPFTIEHVASCP